MTGTESRELSDHGPIVRHLRLLHYIIMIACVLVFIFSVFNDKAIIDQAFAEETELQKVIGRWHSRNFYRFCDSFSEKPIIKNAPKIKRYFNGRKAVFSAVVDGKTHVFTLWNNNSLGHYCETKGEAEYWANYHKTEHKNRMNRIDSRMYFATHSSGIGLKVIPKKVSQLAKLWNTMNAGLRVYTLEDLDLKNAILVEKSEITKPYDQVKVAHKGMTHVKDESKLPADAIKYSVTFYYHNVVDDGPKKLFGYKNPGNFHVYVRVRNSSRKEEQKYVAVIPVKTTRHSFKLLPALFKRHKVDQTIVKPGTFRQSFPAMYEMVKDKLKEFQPRILRKEMEAIQEKKTKSFEVGGLKVKIESIQKFGAMAIVALLLYYLLNLRALVYKLTGDNKGFATAWVGIYPDKTSFIFTLTTLLVIPFVVSLVQLWLTFDVTTLEGQVISGSVMGALVIVSFFILINSFKLFRKVRQYATRVK